MLLTASLFHPSLITLIISLAPSAFSYPHCNPALYGTPVEDDCRDIFFDRPWTGNKGLSSLDKKLHYFGAVGNPSSRPADVDRSSWSRRVDLPRTWHHGECSALLSPNLYSTGQPKYDTGKYADIADAFTSIEMACAFGSELHLQTGVMEGGSIDGAGLHYRLTLIIYHPRSRFAEIIRPYIAAMRIIDYGAITIDAPPDANTNPFIDPPAGHPQHQHPAESSSGSSQQQLQQQCGQTPYCARSSHCSNEGCICVADGNINRWSSSCKAFSVDSSAVLASGGRGLLADAGPSSNASAATTSSTNNSDPTAPTAVRPETTTTTITPIEGSSSSSLLSDLACPCNCTYVSKQCCTASAAGIVHEDPVHRLGALSPPPNGTLECDLRSGDWRQKGNV
ncbi:MAG: hypothetical protein Q9207_003906 [Kuettlingeria erythrocarpa]